MKTPHSVLEKFFRLMPDHIEPKFKTAEELLAWHREQAEIDSKRIAAENQKTRLQKIMGKSGISKLHQHCTFENFDAYTDDHKQAAFRAKNYAENFGKYFGGFVFSGNPGTGKNHLAAAIGNYLIQKGHSILIVTLPDLMMRVRETYDKDSRLTESQLINDLCSVDLLVFDDVGVQRSNLNEYLIVFQVIDKRTSSKKPTGILTNLSQQKLAESLGERVIDRLRMGKPIAINFAWESYRKKIK